MRILSFQSLSVHEYLRHSMPATCSLAFWLFVHFKWLSELMNVFLSTCTAAYMYNGGSLFVSVCVEHKMYFLFSGLYRFSFVSFNLCIIFIAPCEVVMFTLVSIVYISVHWVFALKHSVGKIKICSLLIFLHH